MRVAGLRDGAQRCQGGSPEGPSGRPDYFFLSPAAAPRRTLLGLVRLLRLPATPSALSNILMGYALAHGGWTPVAPLLGLLAASALLYSAGMALNDAADADIDRLQRPTRPIPAGLIARRSAYRLGAALLAAGLIAALAAGASSRMLSPHASLWRPVAAAAALVVAIAAYDLWLKRYAFSVLLLGLCRGLNVLLGMSTSPQPLDLPTTLLAAGGAAVFVSGLSWMARRETEGGRSAHPAIAGITMSAGVLLLAAVAFPRLGFHPGQQVPELAVAHWCLLAAVSLPWLRRTARAVARPDPLRIRHAVTISLFSIILLDAILCFLATGGDAAAAAAVALLVIPGMLALRRADAT